MHIMQQKQLQAFYLRCQPLVATKCCKKEAANWWKQQTFYRMLLSIMK